MVGAGGDDKSEEEGEEDEGLQLGAIWNAGDKAACFGTELAAEDAGIHFDWLIMIDGEIQHGPIAIGRLIIGDIITENLDIGFRDNYIGGLAKDSGKLDGMAEFVAECFTELVHADGI